VRLARYNRIIIAVAGTAMTLVALLLFGLFVAEHWPRDYPEPGLSAETRVFNVIVRTLSSNAQRLLLDHPAQVSAVALPAAKCAQGEGPVPCGRMLWQIRVQRDTNKDGKLSDEDGSELLEARTDGSGTAQPIVQESVRKALEAVIETKGGKK
jgi:hypothetical protein